MFVVAVSVVTIATITHPSLELNSTEMFPAQHQLTSAGELLPTAPAEASFLNAAFFFYRKRIILHDINTPPPFTHPVHVYVYEDNDS